MTYEITEEDVRDSFTTNLSGGEVALAIAVVAQSHPCLEAQGVDVDIGIALQLYAVRHILSMQENFGRGPVTSQSAPSGASQSYGKWSGPEGSPYLAMLRQLDQTGCVVGVLENLHRVDARSVGGGRHV